jgi:hypothetical protein
MADNPKQTLRDLESSLSDIKTAGDAINNLNAKLNSSITSAATLTSNFKNGADIAVKLANELNKAAATELYFEDRILKERKKGNSLKAAELKTQQNLNRSLIEQLGNLQKINQQNQTQKTLSNALKQSGEKILGTQIASVKEMFTLTGLFTLLVEMAFKADEQTTELAKSLSLTKTEAAGVREQFVSFSTEIGDTSVTTNRLVESFSKLSKAVGFNVPLSKSLLKEFTTLTKNIKISEEAAAGLGKITLATGKSARSVTTEALETAQALQSQNGIQLDNREVLEDIGKVSGQLLANFKANPSAIAAAVTQAKLLGTNLETVKKQGESLLNFESSIQSELEAELLTGRALNLEKARAAALSGDQVTVMKELNNQNVDFNKFSNMNVLAQQSLAQALGLSADELSDQLFKQQMMGKSRAEVVALGGEEAAQRLEALSAQDKFNNAVEKLKDIVGNLVSGPFGQLLDVIGNMLSGVMQIFSFMQKILGNTMFKVLMGGLIGAAVAGPAAPIGALIGAGVALLGVAGGASPSGGAAFASGGIVTSPITNATVGEAGPEAIIPLSSPTANAMLGGGNSELLGAINDMKNVISSQKFNITLQNQNNIERSGTSIREYSYKLS